MIRDKLLKDNYTVLGDNVKVPNSWEDYARLLEGHIQNNSIDNLVEIIKDMPYEDVIKISNDGVYNMLSVEVSSVKEGGRFKSIQYVKKDHHLGGIVDVIKFLLEKVRKEIEGNVVPSQEKKEFEYEMFLNRKKMTSLK